MVMIMKFRYREPDEMKDSGVEWLGDIPKDWKSLSLRYLINILTDYTANGSFGDLAKNVKYIDMPDYARLVRLTDLRKNFENNGVYVNKQAYNYLGKSKLEGEEFLMANVGAYAGLTWEMPKVNFLCTLAPNMFLMKFYKNKLKNKFALYIGESSYFSKQLFIKATSSSAQPKLNKEDIRTLRVVLPKILEQQKITEFLDQKTSQFDTIIEKKQILIEKLEEAKKSLISEVVTGKKKVISVDGKLSIVDRKPDEMKDSGVEWLGDIPRDWNVKKLKHIADCNPSNVDKKIKDNEKDVLLCNYTDVYYNDFITSQLNFMKATANILQIEKFRLLKGDIILTKDSESPDDIAIPAFVSENLDNIICGYHLILIRSHNDIISKYIFRLISSIGAKNYFETQAKGVTRYGIGVGSFENLSLSLPILQQEQQLISDFLDQRTEQIDNTIEKYKLQVEKLKEAKQSLISEAVTGKIEIIEEV